jgi:hypothetical protein
VENLKRLEYETKTDVKHSFLPRNDQKKVQWTPSVQDNHGKTRYPSHPTVKESRRVLNSRVMSPKHLPAVPELPRSNPKSRAPPPAPRPRRLPSPDLFPVKEELFFGYEMGVYDKKMKAQCKSFFKACTFFGAIN